MKNNTKYSMPFQARLLIWVVVALFMMVSPIVYVGMIVWRVFTDAWTCFIEMPEIAHNSMLKSFIGNGVAVESERDK